MADSESYADRHIKSSFDTFLYMRTEKEHRGHTNYYVKVWRIHDNILTLVGTMYYHHMDTRQAVCELLAAKLPDEFGRFPDDFIPLRETDELINDRRTLHCKSGFSMNYPQYLASYRGDELLKLVELTSPNSKDELIIG